ncbi:MAG: 2-amino-4-hydroxy-6-hydroxymethyldihydropteridine diphosphokinase [Pseudomonadota bacterium]
MSEGRRHWVPAYIGIGSNLNDPAKQVRDAIERLASLTRSRLMASSGLYRSDPMGTVKQPDFINAVVCLLTTLRPKPLLNELLALEESAGRHRDGERWGPRVLDLDLLLYARQTISETDLTVPHPGIAERNFVLFPLREIAPAARVPGRGTVAALAARFPANATDVTRLDS